MDNMDKGLSEWVLINREKIPQMPPNLSTQIVCPSPKVLDFDEKRLQWASEVHGWPHHRRGRSTQYQGSFKMTTVTLMQYIDRILQKVTLRKLNKMRVGFKHLPHMQAFLLHIPANVCFHHLQVKVHCCVNGLQNLQANTLGFFSICSSDKI